MTSRDTVPQCDGGRPPGALLLHPAVLASLLVLLVNDHCSKTRWPGFITGKLSDFAGVLLLPIVLHAACELAFFASKRRAMAPRQTQRVLEWAAWGSALGFALPEISVHAAHVYQVGLGAIQWPFRTLGAVLAGTPLPPLQPVHATADPTDLFALPMAWAAVRLGRQRPEEPGQSQAQRSALATPLVALLTLTASTTHAQSAPSSAERTKQPVPKRGKAPYTHDGIYASAEAGFGGLFVESDASLTNGFQQPIDSGARGILSPAFSVALGVTVRGSSLVLGGRVTRAVSREPRIDTLDQAFIIRDFTLELTDVTVFTHYYPHAADHFHFGGGLGVLVLQPSEGRMFQTRPIYAGHTHAGPSLSVEAGHGMWIGKQWSAGGRLRLSAAVAYGEHGTTFLVAPTFTATISWH